ncbi:polynucleotide 5'-hydroxyl-kinase NOL9 [Gossypium australe]|uniref:Polynucleotide 5'-hydroxyl-kinase NOL9 n=1 Tax=Gossypium australe TaxID=47621 RepID=A0A5B6UTU1_9ROSI|nr:polynucleotide 5'-hydroxyl-kinase NOL9 [Gossypium australe]
MITESLNLQRVKHSAIYKLDGPVEQAYKTFWGLARVNTRIVRGIDTFKGVLYVITPVPPSTLEKVNLFLQGFIQIPTCLLQVKRCRSPYVTSNVLSDRKVHPKKGKGMQMLCFKFQTC